MRPACERGLAQDLERRPARPLPSCTRRRLDQARPRQPGRQRRHPDMDRQRSERSQRAAPVFSGDWRWPARDGADLGRCRRSGRRPSPPCWRRPGGVNTHRGAIFGLGLLCAAAGPRAENDRKPASHLLAPRRRSSARRWGEEIRTGPIPLFSHGTAVLRRYGAGAPAPRRPMVSQRLTRSACRPCGRALVGAGRLLRGSVQACFALIASVRDKPAASGRCDGCATPPSRRRIPAGRRGCCPTGADAGRCGACGFVARNLSPGGCADLLAMTLFVDALGSGGASNSWR